MDEPALEFRSVSFVRADVTVVDRVSLSVEEGQVVALVGRSGAGKSTLLKLVNRLLLPSAGAVLVDGRDTREWDAMRLRRRTGYVLQEVGLFPHVTVADNVSVVPRLEQWPADRVAARVRDLLDLVGLPAAEFGPRYPHELSGGERQRVGVARALAADPPVMLMDEPFGALDPLTRAELHDEFRRIQARVAKTVLIVTHDMAEAFVLADRIGVIDAGALVACDAPAAIAASGDARVQHLLNAVPMFVRPSPAGDPDPARNR
jgi:osmoprotectant transport system ATP-binding protein